MGRPKNLKPKLKVDIKRKMLNEIYASREDVKFYKQSKEATNIYLKEGSLGLSYHAEKLFKGILELFTQSNFESLPEEAPNRKEYSVREVYGIENEPFIKSVPVIRVTGKKALLKAMLGREITSKDDGRPYIELLEALKELKEEKTFTYERKTGNRIERLRSTAPLFVIKEDSFSIEQNGEELFAPIYYEIYIASDFVFHGIQQSPLGFTRLPTHPEKLLKTGGELTKKQELVFNYISTLYAEKYGHFLHQKNKGRASISFKDLFKAMLLKENQYTGKHKSRHVNELREAIEVINKYKPEFIARITFEPSEEQVLIVWEASLYD